MAEKKSTSRAAASEETKATDYEMIQAIGPKNEYNAAEILRYKPLNARKNYVEIQVGQVLRVGEDIDPEDAERLLNLPNWNFERVTE